MASASPSWRCPLDAVLSDFVARVGFTLSRSVCGTGSTGAAVGGTTILTLAPAESGGCPVPLAGAGNIAATPATPLCRALVEREERHGFKPCTDLDR